MKKIKTKIEWEKLIAFLFTIMGFSSCRESCFEDSFGSVEYGCPTVDYKVKISVSNEENNKSIEGIQATFYDYIGDIEDNLYLGYTDDTLYSSANGQINGIIRHYSDTRPLVIKLEDVDGEKNGGEFEDKEVIIKAPRTNMIEEGTGNWNRGTFLLEEDLTMTKK